MLLKCYHFTYRSQTTANNSRQSGSNIAFKFTFNYTSHPCSVSYPTSLFCSISKSHSFSQSILLHHLNSYIPPWVCLEYVLYLHLRPFSWRQKLSFISLCSQCPMRNVWYIFVHVNLLSCYIEHTFKICISSHILPIFNGSFKKTVCKCFWRQFKIVTQKDPKFASFHRHTESTATYGKIWKPAE